MANHTGKLLLAIMVITFCYLKEIPAASASTSAPQPALGEGVSRKGRKYSSRPGRSLKFFQNFRQGPLGVRSGMVGAKTGAVFGTHSGPEAVRKVITQTTFFLIQTPLSIITTTFFLISTTFFLTATMVRTLELGASSAELSSVTVRGQGSSRRRRGT